MCIKWIILQMGRGLDLESLVDECLSEHIPPTIDMPGTMRLTWIFVQSDIWISYIEYISILHCVLGFVTRLQCTWNGNIELSTSDLTFEEEFTIYELLARKEDMIANSFNLLRKKPLWVPLHYLFTRTTLYLQVLRYLFTRINCIYKYYAIYLP